MSDVGRELVATLGEAVDDLKAGRMVFQVWFRWEDGRMELRYERPWPSEMADELKADVDGLRRAGKAGGWESPYSYKVVPTCRTTTTSPSTPTSG